MRNRLVLPLVALLSATALTPAAAQTLPLTGPAPAATTAAAPTAAALTPAVKGEGVLRRIAVTGDSGFLQGESASREWPLFVKASELGRATALQIGYSVSVSASPTQSRLHVYVNDRAVGDIELKGGEQNVVRKLQIDPGLLSPGLNAVRVEFESVHRVDCSVDATYELWTRMDADQTGLLITAPQTPAANTERRDVMDLFTVRTSNEGVTPIYVRSPLNPDPKSAERLIRTVDALARNLKLASPAVSFGAPPKGEAGLEVAIATREQLSEDRFDVIGRDRISVTANDPRPLLLLTAGDDVSLDQQVQSMVGELDKLNVTGSAAGVRAAQRLAGRPIDGDTTVKLADLGLDNTSGHGRRWERSVDISLPQNFVASVYEQATLRLKGAAPGGLMPGSNIRVSVNSVGAASLPLGDAPIDLDGQSLNLPFSLFHPGVNRLTFETVTVSPDDARCDIGNRHARSQVHLSPDTTLSFPHFTRLQVGPDVAHALAVRSGSGADIIHAALVRPDQDSLAAAMTMFANLAMLGRYAEIDMTYGRPTTFDQTGVIFGPTAEMPHELTRTFAGLYVQSAERSYSDDGDAQTQLRGNGDVKPMTTSEGAGSGSMFVRIVRDLRWMGFAFDDPSERRKLIVRPDDVIVADAPTSGWGVIRAGVAIPRIATAPKTWIVVASDSNEQLARGMRSLAASGQWDGFSGQASVFEPSTARVASLSQGRMFYTLPADWTIADLRDALAIIFSDHVIAYIGVLILLTALLSAVTMGLLSQPGRRNN